MTIPQEIRAGDSVILTAGPFVDGQGRQMDSASYALTYLLRGPSVLDVVAAASGQGWAATLTTTQSASLAAGNYIVSTVLTRASERITVAEARLVVLPDLSSQPAGYDARSLAERALADAESALASFKASQGKVKRYKIGTREMEFAGIAEILEAISYWRAKVLNEQAARDIANGLGNPRNLMVRFR